MLEFRIYPHYPLNPHFHPPTPSLDLPHIQRKRCRLKPTHNNIIKRSRRRDKPQRRCRNLPFRNVFHRDFDQREVVFCKLSLGLRSAIIAAEVFEGNLAAGLIQTTDGLATGVGITENCASDDVLSVSVDFAGGDGVLGDGAGRKEMLDYFLGSNQYTHPSYANHVIGSALSDTKISKFAPEREIRGRLSLSQKYVANCRLNSDLAAKEFPSDLR